MGCGFAAAAASLKNCLLSFFLSLRFWVAGWPRPPVASSVSLRSRSFWLPGPPPFGGLRPCAAIPPCGHAPFRFCGRSCWWALGFLCPFLGGFSVGRLGALPLRSAKGLGGVSFGVLSPFGLAAAATQSERSVCRGCRPLPPLPFGFPFPLPRCPLSRGVWGGDTALVVGSFFASPVGSALPPRLAALASLPAPRYSRRCGRLALASRGAGAPFAFRSLRFGLAGQRSPLRMALRPLLGARSAPLRSASARRPLLPLCLVCPSGSAPLVLVARVRLRASLRSAPFVRLAPLRSAPLSPVAPPLALLGLASLGLRPLPLPPRSSRPPVRRPALPPRAARRARRPRRSCRFCLGRCGGVSVIFLSAV